MNLSMTTEAEGPMASFVPSSKVNSPRPVALVFTTSLKNNGDDFPRVPDASIDFVFSFGAFVHFDLDLIDRYLGNIKRLLTPTSNVVIQYSDKTKPMAQQNSSFSENDPDKMRALVLSHGYAIFEEDLKTMWHSSIVRFGVPR
jgi:hypothetical protein